MTVEIIFTTAAVITALGVIFGGVYATLRVVNRVSQAIGVDHKGRTISERLERVEHQLWENGGSSLADRVNRIEKVSTETSTEIKVIKEFIISGTIPVAAPTPKVRAVRSKKAS
jgi:cob(I)alamin adenosyltransferase